jgi:hypothetical protein
MTLNERFEELRARCPEDALDDWHEYDPEEAVVYLGSLLGLNTAEALNLDVPLDELLEEVAGR